jgi:hypothetical protein
LESIAYLLVYFLKGGLPWQKMRGANKQERYHKIMEKKMMIPVEMLCRGLPGKIFMKIKRINYFYSRIFNIAQLHT